VRPQCVKSNTTRPKPIILPGPRTTSWIGDDTSYASKLSKCKTKTPLGILPRTQTDRKTLQRLLKWQIEDSVHFVVTPDLASDLLSPPSYAIHRLNASAHTTGLQVLSVLGAVLAFGLMLFPLAPDVPSPEALMARVVACEMAILLEALLLVAARDKVDLLIVAHADRLVEPRTASELGSMISQLYTGTEALQLTAVCDRWRVSNHGYRQLLPCHDAST